ncbi:MAG: fibronectin type III domain-containing protein, partial [Candidatus Dadabacteria bacterium]|nr:fibronectin type III domain-containing protein [Candidatus Dadabacteria bacterium]
MALALMLSIINISSTGSRADTWYDDFTESGFDFNARWVRTGIGMLIPDGTSFAIPSTFDPVPENVGFPIADEDLPSWYGPGIRTEQAVFADFNVSVKLHCTAETTSNNVGKAFVRLLDTDGIQIYAFGWSEVSMSGNKAALSLFGSGDDTILFTTGESSEYSIFIDKELTLQRDGPEIRFYAEGTEKYVGPAVSKTIKYIEVVFLRVKSLDMTVCTPEMKVNSIAVETSPPTVPNAPTYPIATGNDRTAELSWSAPPYDGGSPITSYNLYRGTSTGAFTFLTTVAGILNYSDADLINGQTYYYQVSAVNDVGEGPRSEEVSAMPETVPAPPGNLQATAGNEYVRLTWSPPVDDGGSQIINYKIYRGDASG